MTTLMKKSLALGGLFFLLAGAAGAADAQGAYNGSPMMMHHGPMMHDGMMMHRHPGMGIRRAKYRYAEAVAHGNYAAAERAHMRAMMIRHHIRARREMGYGHQPGY